MGRVDRVEAAEEIIENLSVLAHGINKRVREFSDRQISRRDRQKLKQLIGTLTEMSARGN
jgi:hypothetical protein